MDSLALLYLSIVPAWLGFVCGMGLGLVVVAVIEWREGGCEMLKLWIVQRNDDRASYDHYLGFVCAAETEEQARNMHPSGDDADWEARDVVSSGKTYHIPTCWVDRDDAGKLSVRMIGIAADNVAAGVLFTERQGD